MKKHVDIFMSAIWLALLLALMLRMPVIRLLQEPACGFAKLDLVLSALFCATGIVSSVFAYVFSKKQLFAVPLVNIILFIAMLVLIVISTASGDRGMLDFSLYFVNLFCFVLSLEGNMIAYCAVFLLLQILSAVLLYILTRLKKEK